MIKKNGGHGRRIKQRKLVYFFREVFFLATAFFFAGAFFFAAGFLTAFFFAAIYLPPYLCKIYKKQQGVYYLTHKNFYELSVYI